MKLYTIKEAALLLSLKESRIRTAVFRKEVEHVKLGRLIRFSQEHLKNWVNQNTKGPT